MSKKRIKIKVKNITVRELREVLSQLPVIAGGTEPQRHQVIEGSEDSAHFRITKEESSEPSGYVFYACRVSGSSEDSRLSLSSIFIGLLGKPLMEFPAKALSNTDSFYWNAKEIDEEN